MYNIQHNGKGKNHLVNDGKIICNSKGELLFTSTKNVIIENHKLYEIDSFTEQKFDLFLPDYCKKCLNKIWII